MTPAYRNIRCYTARALLARPPCVLENGTLVMHELRSRHAAIAGLRSEG